MFEELTAAETCYLDVLLAKDAALRGLLGRTAAGNDPDELLAYLTAEGRFGHAGVAAIDIAIVQSYVCPTGVGLDPGVIKHST